MIEKFYTTSIIPKQIVHYLSCIKYILVNSDKRNDNHQYSPLHIHILNQNLLFLDQLNVCYISNATSQNNISYKILERTINEKRNNKQRDIFKITPNSF